MVSSFLLLIFTVLGAESTVPVLLWGSDSLSSLPIPFAGHSISSNAFQKNYIEKLLPCQNCDKKNLVVFVQDKLSLEDFTHYGHVFEDTKDGGIFHNVKSYMGSQPSLTLSSVHLPGDIITQLKKKFENVQEVHLPKDISSVKPTGPNGLLVVHLPDTHGNGRIEDNLKENDVHISHVLKQYSEADVPYTALYTARESSKLPTNEAVFAQGRHLLAKTAENGTIVQVDNCTLLYYTKASIVLTPIDSNGKPNGEPVTSEIFGTPDSSQSKCDNTSSENEFILTWKNPGENVTTTDITVKMHFNMSRSGYWSMIEMLLSYTAKHNKTVKETDVKMNGQALNAWKGYSYHCSNTGNLIQQMKNTNETHTYSARLVFEDFQIQPFNLKNGQFSYPNDCIPFFTLPIWSGLVTMFILVGILTFGMYMMMMMTTMDRFDDPKGNAITVITDDKS